MEKWQSGSVLEMTTAEVFYKLVKICIESKIDLPYSIVIIGKTMLEYDGVLRKIEPNLDIIKSFKEIVEKKHVTDIMKFGEMKNMLPLGKIESIAESLPENLQTFAKKLIESGLDFSVHFGPTNKN